MRAYAFLLERNDLTVAEKLILIVLCRFWPSPFWGSNASIAKSLAVSERYVEMLVRRLAKKKIIKKGYAHSEKKGKHHTVRVIVPQCFGDKCSTPINWIEPEQPDGRQTEHLGASPPYNIAFSPEQRFDLLERNRRMNIKATSLPLPAQEQAKTSEENSASGPTGRIKYSDILKQKALRHTPLMTPEEFEKNRRKQIKALLANS